MIEAANRIHHRPYAWGGGHRDWNSRGFRLRHPLGLLQAEPLG